MAGSLKWFAAHQTSFARDSMATLSTHAPAIVRACVCVCARVLRALHGLVHTNGFCAINGFCATRPLLLQMALEQLQLFLGPLASSCKGTPQVSFFCWPINRGPKLGSKPAWVKGHARNHPAPWPDKHKHQMAANGFQSSPGAREGLIPMFSFF